MADMTLADEDRAEIKAILTHWRESGVENPLLPADVDLDGDGIVDSFGLDADGEVIVVSGNIADTVYAAEGEDVHLPTEEMP